MLNFSRRSFMLSTAALAATPAHAQSSSGMHDELRRAFNAPPDSAKPRVWWHWMNGNVTREGIAKDFAWMKRVGIGGVQNFDAALATPQVVENRLVYMSPEWKDAFRYAVRRADDLDLEFAIAASPGWSETGGPWVEPKDGMKKLVWSEAVIDGGARFTGSLPAPPAVTGAFQNIALNEGEFTSATGRETPSYYADVAVLAFPLRAEARPLPAPRMATSNGEVIDVSLLNDGDPLTGIPLPASEVDAPGVVALEFARNQIVRSATISVAGLEQFAPGGPQPPALEISRDGRSWRKLADMALSEAPMTASFAPVSARYFRLVFSVAPPPDFLTSSTGVDPGMMGALGGGGEARHTLTMFQLSSEPRVNAFEAKAGFSVSHDYFALDAGVGPDIDGVDPETVLDITVHMTPEGRLDWAAPRGRWKVLRFGYSLTGKMNHPATAEATGLEVDKYDATAVETYCNTYFDMYREVTGGNLMGRRGLRAVLTDSIEVGPSNWTPRLLEHFQRLRGYDAKPWLPALTGEIVGSRTRSDAFLYDFRRTLADLLSSEHYQTVARVAHERDLTVYGESLEGTRATLGDDLDMRAHADIPMSALWTYSRAPRPVHVADVRGAASVAHLYGRSLVACESLTSAMQPWSYAPRDLQPMIDAIFVNGVNRPVIHTSVHQPLDRGPGLSLMIFGQHFTRLDAWAEMAKPWVDYIARNSYLLQQGRHVADVAYFYGEEAPVGVLAEGDALADAPQRYGYDFVSAHAVANVLSVENGDLVSPGGARYKALYLNASSAQMTLPVLRKLAALAEAGATIIGDAPISSPSLVDDTAEFARLVRQLWPGGAVADVGRGRVIAGRDVEGALGQIGISPDFEYSGDGELQFLHRSLDDGELYFVSNRSSDAVQTEARFRVAARAPDFWRADSGSVEPASYRVEGGGTIVPLDLRANESVFIVFRRPATTAAVQIQKSSYHQIGRVDGSWDVAFQSGRGAPARITMPALASLSEQSDPGVKYFSGVATYTTRFDLPAGVRRGDSLFLDLGAFGDVAEVRVNRRPVGTVWKAPHRIDVGAFVRSGRNTLDIRVANLWVNRLIGDRQPGAEAVAFTVMPTFAADAPLRPSGLIGPVTLWASDE